MSQKNKNKNKKRQSDLGGKDDFATHFETLCEKGFIEKTGRDPLTGEVEYRLTPKTLHLCALKDFVKATDSILEAHGRK